MSALARVRGRTVFEVQEELLRSFPRELEMGEALMYAHGWTAGVVREGLQALAAEEGLDPSGLQDADVWRWLRGEVFPRDSLRRLCRLFRCHQAHLGWPARGNDVAIDFTDGRQADVGGTHAGGEAQPARFPRRPGPALVPDDEVWDMKRRDFVRAGGMSLLWTAMSLGPGAPEVWEWWQSQPGRKPPTVEAIESYQNVLDECWALCDAGETGAAEQAVRSILPAVAPHVPDRPGAGIVMARGLLLIGVVSHHQLRVQDKVSFCQQAVEYARRSGDPTALVSALVDLAVAFRYAGQPENAMAANVEALTHAERSAPSVRSRAYAAAAGAFAQSSRIPEAATYIQRAHEAFPADSHADPHWSGSTSIWYVSFHEGRALAATGRLAQAEKAFQGYVEHPTGGAVPDRMRLETVNERGRAAVAAGDLDLYATCLRSGVSGALAIGSGKRYEEAVSIYREEMPSEWRRKPLISDIAEEFRLHAPTPFS